MLAVANQKKPAKASRFGSDRSGRCGPSSKLRFIITSAAWFGGTKCNGRSVRGVETFFSIAELRETRGDQSGASDLEDGSPRVLLSARGGSMSRSSQERKDQLPPPANTGSRSWQAQGFSGQALYCIRRCRGWVVKLYHFEICSELSEFQTRKSRGGDARECAYWHTRPYEMIKFGQWFNGPRRDAQYRRRRFKVTERGIGGRTCVRIE